jgi:hypothetical protein
MSKLNETDIQGFVLRGYNMPFARYLFLHFEDPARAANLVHRLMGEVTTGQRIVDLRRSTFPPPPFSASQSSSNKG